MTQRDAIDMADEPATIASLVTDFRALGLEPGMTVMVHSSLSRRPARAMPGCTPAIAVSATR